MSAVTDRVLQQMDENACEAVLSDMKATFSAAALLGALLNSNNVQISDKCHSIVMDRSKALQNSSSTAVSTRKRHSSNQRNEHKEEKDKLGPKVTADTEPTTDNCLSSPLKQSESKSHTPQNEQESEETQEEGELRGLVRESMRVQCEEIGSSLRNNPHVQELSEILAPFVLQPKMSNKVKPWKYPQLCKYIEKTMGIEITKDNSELLKFKLEYVFEAYRREFEKLEVATKSIIEKTRVFSLQLFSFGPPIDRSPGLSEQIEIIKGKLNEKLVETFIYLKEKFGKGKEGKYEPVDDFEEDSQDSPSRSRRGKKFENTYTLKKWYHDHVENPYPSDQEKRKLAYTCDMLPKQVSTWFGNYRMRFKAKMDGKSGKSDRKRKRKSSSSRSNKRRRLSSENACIDYPDKSSNNDDMDDDEGSDYDNDLDDFVADDDLADFVAEDVEVEVDTTLFVDDDEIYDEETDNPTSSKRNTTEKKETKKKAKKKRRKSKSEEFNEDNNIGDNTSIGVTVAIGSEDQVRKLNENSSQNSKQLEPKIEPYHDATSKNNSMCSNTNNSIIGPKYSRNTELRNFDEIHPHHREVNNEDHGFTTTTTVTATTITRNKSATNTTTTTTSFSSRRQKQLQQKQPKQIPARKLQQKQIPDNSYQDDNEEDSALQQSLIELSGLHSLVNSQPKTKFNNGNLSPIKLEDYSDFSSSASQESSTISQVASTLSEIGKEPVLGINILHSNDNNLNAQRPDLTPQDPTLEYNLRDDSNMGVQNDHMVLLKQEPSHNERKSFSHTSSYRSHSIQSLLSHDPTTPPRTVSSLPQHLGSAPSQSRPSLISPTVSSLPHLGSSQSLSQESTVLSPSLSSLPLHESLKTNLPTQHLVAPQPIRLRHPFTYPLLQSIQQRQQNQHQ